MENEELQQCQNCKKQFTVDKIDLHEAYCFRNIKKCPKCDKMIDINDQEQHQTEQHSNQQCQLCRQQFSPQVYATHPQTCPKKPIFCEFCQNTLPLQDFAKHKQSCGSRTSPCSKCQRPIMLKDLSHHEANCQGRREQRRQRSQVSQDHVRNNNLRNIQNRHVSRERQNSQKLRQRNFSSNNIPHKPKAYKIKPSHMIGPESIKPSIDPVPLSVRLAMKVRQHQRLPLKSKN